MPNRTKSILFVLVMRGECALGRLGSGRLPACALIYLLVSIGDGGQAVRADRTTDGEDDLFAGCLAPRKSWRKSLAGGIYMRAGGALTHTVSTVHCVVHAQACIAIDR
jgi:hypothetical protein